MKLEKTNDEDMSEIAREEEEEDVTTHPMLDTLNYCSQLESNIDASSSVALPIPRKVVKELTSLNITLSILQRRSTSSSDCHTSQHQDTLTSLSDP